MSERRASISRKTKETEVSVTLDLEGKGEVECEVGISFLEHMLQQLAFHARFDLRLLASGASAADYHHLVEDVGICLGQALAQALGEKKGIARYGWAVVPFDEALVLAAVDMSGRAFCQVRLELGAEKVGDFDVEVVEDFWRALAVNGRFALHIVEFAGRNTHHKVEAAFKAVGRALATAVALEAGREGVPSTKGVL